MNCYSYRFTASLIELLLFTQVTSRHRVLSAFIYALTGFRVTDAIDLEEEEPPLTNGIPEHIKNYYGPVGEKDRLFGKLNGRCNVLLCFDISISNLLGQDLSYIFDAFMRWRIGSQPTTIRIEGDMHQTIASGIGHLKLIKPDRLLDTKDIYFAYLCEPLVVLYLSSTFAQRQETTNLSWLTDATFTARNNSSLGFMFEEAVLMIILQMFGGDLSWFFQDWETKELILSNGQSKISETLTPANYQRALQTVNQDEEKEEDGVVVSSGEVRVVVSSRRMTIDAALDLNHLSIKPQFLV